MVTAAGRLALLRRFFRQARADEVSFLKVLNDARDKQIDQTIGTASGHRQLASVSANGRNTAFFEPNRFKAKTSDEYTDELELLDIILRDVTAANGFPYDEKDASHDAAIEPLMVADDRINNGVPVDSFHIDHTLGRWPSGAGFTQ